MPTLTEELTAQQRAILEDMKAMIEYELEFGLMGFETVLVTLTHDCGGILQKKSCFSPRSTNYSKHLDDRRARSAVASAQSRKK